MSKREILAWIFLAASLLAVAWLGWQLFGHWPDIGYFESREEGLTLPLQIAFYVILAGSVGVQRWHPHEPLDDERDRLIRGEGARHGFFALALLNVLAGVFLLAYPPGEFHMGPQWMRCCLLWMVLVAVAVDSGVQLHRYRRG